MRSPSSLRPYSRVLGLLALCCAGAGSPQARAVMIGVPDTFENGTVSEWYGGTTITNVLGGPGGGADHFLRVQSNGVGGGSGSKVAVHNADARWTGDYVMAGVTGIQVDMRNLGTTTLNMRLVLFGLGSRWTSTASQPLAVGGDWQRLTFPVNSGSLTRVLGSGAYLDSMADISQIMFRHDGGSPSSGGEAINGTVGMDNIAAIPAPGAAGIILVGGAWSARRSAAR